MKALTKRQALLSPPSRQLGLGIGLATLLAACNGGNSSVAGSADSGTSVQKTEAGGESPSRPAPISGAYLVGILPAIKSTDTKLCSPVQARGKDRKKLPAAALKDISFSYAPPPGATRSFNITFYDLSKSTRAYFYNGIYCLNLPPAGPVHLGLTGPAALSDRDQAILYMLKSTPLFSHKSVLLSSVKPAAPPSAGLRKATGTRAGLSLAGPPAASIGATFDSMPHTPQSPAALANQTPFNFAQPEGPAPVLSPTDRPNTQVPPEVAPDLAPRVDPAAVEQVAAPVEVVSPDQASVPDPAFVGAEQVAAEPDPTTYINGANSVQDPYAVDPNAPAPVETAPPVDVAPPVEMPPP